MPQKVLTPNQARARLREKGVTITQWAAANDFSRDAVYRVLGGQYKAYFGRAHDIAVALGLKLPIGQSSPSGDSRNIQRDKVA